MLKDFLSYGETVLQSDLPLPVLDEHFTFVEQFGQTLQVEDEDSFESLHVDYVPNEEFTEVLKASLGNIVVRSTDMTRSVLEGNFSKTVMKGEETCFTIITRDQDGESIYCEDDLVVVNISTSTEEELYKEIEDNQNGSYKVTCTPQSSGKHKVSVEINGEPLAGSPWTFDVISPGDLS